MAGTAGNSNGKKVSSTKRSTPAKKGSTSRTPSKNTSSKSRSKTSGKKTPQKSGVSSFIGEEATLLIVLALSILLLLSNLHIGVGLLDKVNDLIFGICGILAYVMPVILFLGVAFLMSNKYNKIAKIKFGAGLALFLLLCAFAQLIMVEDFTKMNFVENFQYGSKHKIGGGMLGWLLGLFVTKLAGTAGGYVILVVLSIISVVIITERSFLQGVQKGGKKVYQTARDENERMRERNRVRREERELERSMREAEEQPRRMDRKAEGVMLDTLLTPADEEMEPVYLDGAPIGEELEDVDEPEETPGLDEAYVNRFDREILDKKLTNEKVVMDTDIIEKNLVRKLEQILPQADAYKSNQEIELFPEIEKYEVEEKAQEPEEEDIPQWTWNQAGMEIQESVAEPLPAVEESEQSWEESVEQTAEDTSMPVNFNEIVDNSYEERIAEPVIVEKPVAESLKTQEASPKQEPVRPSVPESKPESRKIGEPVVLKPASAKPETIAGEPIRKVEKPYEFPPLSLLHAPDKSQTGSSRHELEETAMTLQSTLKSFGVKAKVTDVSCGPAVTRFELHPEQGVKVSKIVGLADDIKLNLAAEDIRIEAPIPGKAAVGIEVPNKVRSGVNLRELLEADEFTKFPSTLAFAVGKDIAGKNIVTDIGKTPHLLIAGATGSGKSVCINTIIMSILYKARPDEVKLIMIDPKVVELSVYNGIPHLLIPVVTDPKKAAGALQWAVTEMTERYEKFKAAGVRDIAGYNKKVEALKDIPGENKPEKLPKIVIIVDELADLMMVAPGDVEASICRIAQLARAAGMHLIIATQRPSVNVITGLIKANMPSRIAFSVTSGIDSRTILDTVGAEKLLGKGDMLFSLYGSSKAVRIQCAFVSDDEVADVVNFLTDNGNITTTYSEEIEKRMESVQLSGGSDGGSQGASEYDEYFVEAGKLIIDKGKGSIGMLQRMYKIGFNRAARIMDQLCEAGVVEEEQGTKPRGVLMSLEEFERYVEDYV